ncbi:PREDICTED: zinc finger A20 and AN1 domain-containing stress-associated protein 8-like [Fragaria vesca subsp. vesca]|uniref:zinc finger A20 and AN1 domain-containing stress-associated protein 8-like n=1 Tax=Fragaria vesca subsp. vesca TaxID=101020 RepID=UPI0002C34EA6|nr:PREDICTED: zinc finger A20 and AN1 domain-containing stress-associated protein 8-like [Fragaria vesca subsp. vesca]
MNLHDESSGCQAPPAGPIICIKHCGFYGAAATMNMCSKCYKDSVMKQEQPKLAASSTGIAINGKPKEPIVSADVHVNVQADPADPKSNFKNSFFSFASQYDASDPRPSSFTFGSGQNNGEVKPPEGKKRCTSCNKRVGLTGFSCRCGDLFCAVHRYPEKHECSYDYRSTGREVLAKANPAVKAEKLDKI